VPFWILCEEHEIGPASALRIIEFGWSPLYWKVLSHNSKKLFIPHRSKFSLVPIRVIAISDFFALFRFMKSIWTCWFLIWKMHEV
jgi:hypothetical protein